MRTALLVFCFSLATLVKGQWNMVNLDTLFFHQAFCVHLVSPTQGYMAVDFDVLKFTINNNQVQKQRVALPFASPATDIRFASNDTGYAVGGGNIYKNFIARTTDAGMSWDSIYGSSGGSFWSVAVVSNTEFYAAGHDILLHSSDAGATLDTLQPGGIAAQEFKQVQFLSADLGFVLAKQTLADQTTVHHLYRTRNGGASWKPIYMDTIGPMSRPVNYNAFCFTDSLKGVLSSTNNWILRRTTTGGYSWSRSYTNPVPDREFVSFEPGPDSSIYATVIKDERFINFSQSGNTGHTWVDEAVMVQPGLQFANRLYLDISSPARNTVFLMTDHFLFRNTHIINTQEEAGVQPEIFPNPATAYLHISLGEGHRVNRFKVFNSVGREVYQQTVKPEQLKFTLNTSTWPSGLYLIVLQQKGESAASGSFVVKK